MPTPHNLMIVTGDSDFKSTFSELAAGGHTTLLAHQTKSASRNLPERVQVNKWDWCMTLDKTTY
ncbi:hypothetical protein Bca4012_059150 [Brassica carinata]|uniref:NYN domain-containing protein n=1 Tax=Brassica carinata TaxID=52824 RepID=A0A8X7V619_BRACI|nr:hypothetical protein Bca52824_029677 [Brassica carinata]